MTKLYRVLGKRGRITIPFEIRQRVGFTYNDVLSFTESPDGRTVTVKREKICDNCSGTKTADKEAEMTLEDFLDSLSAEQQRVALVHLSVKWAEQKAGGHNAGAYLADRANKDGECWPASPTIAAELKLSQSTVHRALRDLRKAGLLETEQRYRTKGGKSSLLYKIRSG